MSSEIKKHLYHYTNVSALALILKNKNFKFSPLTAVDDSEEGAMKDRQQFGKYCFVSSWTDDEKESIPMWNMYTKLSEGIRIKMPANPFKEYWIDGAAVREQLGPDQNVTGPGFSCLIPAEKYFGESYFLGTCTQQYLLRPVEYTDDIEKLYPQILTVEEGNTFLSMNPLGRYKNTYWDFQREWRYLLIFMPMGYKEMFKDATSNKNQENLKKIHQGVDLPFNYYLLELDERKFEQMEITLSPKMDPGNKIIVEELVRAFNPSVKITESVLTGRLR